MDFATSLLILTLSVFVVGAALFLALLRILRQDTKRLEQSTEELGAFEADTQPPH
ncbi:hypothetical protein [Acidovorax radicis]|uniref:hypothetical protein n=1 Tax=Acidovorax radicis TaxID=758826 RepID=UPI0002377146|nr:hypothetical protein [Acidovorax radicis]